MFNTAHILVGLGFVAAGAAMVKYTFQMVNITGTQDWIENITGTGSTYGVYKIFGVLLVVAGLMFATGLGNNLLDFLFSPLRHIFSPPGA